MRAISNEEFKIAYQSIDNKKIMYFASQPFAKMLSYDDLEHCKMIGLWQAMRKYDSGKSKFTSYLTNSVTWECLGALNREVFHSGVPIQSIINDFSSIEANDIIEQLDEYSQGIIRQRFTENLTYKEIGKVNGYSHETARKRVVRVLEKIREIVE